MCGQPLAALPTSTNTFAKHLRNPGLTTFVHVFLIKGKRMGRIGGALIGMTALFLGGCATRPMELAGATCTEREGPEGLVRICETQTQVTVENLAVAPAPVVARDEEAPRSLGLTHGRAADMLAAGSTAAPRTHGKDVCAIDRKRLKQILARRIARRLLADL